MRKHILVIFGFLFSCNHLINSLTACKLFVSSTSYRLFEYIFHVEHDFWTFKRFLYALIYCLPQQLFDNGHCISCSIILNKVTLYLFYFCLSLLQALFIKILIIIFVIWLIKLIVWWCLHSFTFLSLAALWRLVY